MWKKLVKRDGKIQEFCTEAFFSVLDLNELVSQVYLQIKVAFLDTQSDVGKQTRLFR